MPVEHRISFDLEGGDAHISRYRYDGSLEDSPRQFRLLGLNMDGREAIVDLGFEVWAIGFRSIEEEGGFPYEIRMAVPKVPRPEHHVSGNMIAIPSGTAYTSKMLGDAGEHFALSQFTFTGKPATKMPDGWKGYDLAVETGKGLARVSVKTRSETDRWKAGSWFVFDERQICDWLVFVFRGKNGIVRSWVIPFSVALESANNPTKNRKDPHVRYISWAKLIREPLLAFENNWSLNTKPNNGLAITGPVR